MSPRNRLRLILVAEFLRSPRFMICMLLVEIVAAVIVLLNGDHLFAIPFALVALLDLRALRAWAAENLLSRRSR